MTSVSLINLVNDQVQHHDGYERHIEIHFLHRFVSTMEADKQTKLNTYPNTYKTFRRLLTI